MTAITINLLVEEQLSQQAQARDPFKLTVIIGSVLIGLTLATGVILGRTADQKIQDVAALQSKWDKLQNKQPSSSGADTKALQTVAEDYLTVNRGRMLYGPQLALIKNIIPDSIQLAGARFAVVTEMITPKVEVKPGESEAKAARAAKPHPVEHLSLVLEGFVTCARPEIEIDSFIKDLRANPTFSELVDNVRLRSIARSGGNAETAVASLPTVSFAIDCGFKEVKK